MTEAPRRRIRILLRGIVQGVGFRPFAYQLARELELGGFVQNSSAGLLVEVEGPAAALQIFARRIVEEAPPLAWVQESEIREAPLRGDGDFAISSSVAVVGEFSLIAPDIATCEACQRDFTDPANRRYRYPFTNCTNCGPRYTIIRDIPYDRSNTTMAAFPLCADCRREYEEPGDRRFHAQPNACPVCGPSLSVEIAEVQRRLAAGEILAIKGLGGFHLACDARNAVAVEQLRRRKRRSEKPFAIMARDTAAVERLCLVMSQDRAALESARRPIVILPALGPLPGIAPNNRTFGVMLPYTPLHVLLFEGAPYDFLVMTSGNLSEEPIVTSNCDALARLGGVADGFLLHNRDIFMRVDDSVVRIFEGAERVLRRSRGFVPEVIDFNWEAPELLACGGELKNVFCLTKGRHAILSQHIGDLENYETFAFFEETLAHLKRLFRVEPRAVAHDLHPDYLSTRFALGLNLPRIGVQHHEAHIASCMLENGLEGDVIGVAFDGTGYGADGAIWGGEFFTGGYGGFERRMHLRYVPQPGGDAAVRAPWRMAASYRMDTLGGEALAEPRERWIRQMIERRIHTVPTSSCGRLFDAVASLIGLRHEVNFEGQAAVELEMLADSTVQGCYPFALDEETIDFRPTIERIVRDHSSQAVIAARFHNTVAAAILEACVRIRRQTGLRRVCLSGGTFQNVLLVSRANAELQRAGFDVFLHAKVPPNDGGIALGQAAIAAARGWSAA
jgi:hydrogenase maturation protein HypF